jgi:hypothetical protein
MQTKRCFFFFFVNEWVWFPIVRDNVWFYMCGGANYFDANFAQRKVIYRGKTTRIYGHRKFFIYFKRRSKFIFVQIHHRFPDPDMLWLKDAAFGLNFHIITNLFHFPSLYHHSQFSPEQQPSESHFNNSSMMWRLTWVWFMSGMFSLLIIFFLTYFITQHYF